MTPIAPAIALLVAIGPTELDVFTESLVERPAKESPGLFVARAEPRLGVPTMIWAPPSERHPHADQPIEPAARHHLASASALLRLNERQLRELEFVHAHDLGHDAIVVTFQRSIDGAPLFRDRLHVVMNQARDLVAISGLVNPNDPKDASLRAFRLTASTVATTGLVELALPVEPLTVSEPRDGWQRVTSASVTGRVRRVWYGLPHGVEPAWELELSTSELAFTQVFSADDGRVLSRKNLRDDATYRAYADATAPFAPLDSPYGTANTPHPTALAQPTYEGAWISANLITLDARPGRSDPWLAPSATTLSGNNAFLFTDFVAPFGPNDGGTTDGGLADQLTFATAADRFDDAYDLDAGPGPGAQANAAAIHAFYVTNWVHDWLAGAGFDEAAGNAQADNFGRGGKAGDRLVGASFSYSRPDNASMTTFADGESPRLQLGVFSALPVRYLELDGGRIAGTGPLGTRFDVSGPLAPMQSDAGLNGCDELFDRSSLEGRIAIASDVGCQARNSYERARDAGALGLIVFTGSAAFPGLGLTGSALDLPVVGVPGTAIAQTLDGGIGSSVRLVSMVLPGRPSSLDTHVIVHEFGHALSNRLIADTAGLQLKISRSLGEGWSDFLALLQTVQAADANAPSNAGWAGTYGLGAYAAGGLDQTGQPLPHFYRGIRRAPYSTNFEKNGLTFRHLRDGAALPAGVLFGGANSEVHNAGEIWCSMLWEAFAALLTTTPDVEAARQRMLELLVASLKATPANPDYLEARDAVLSVAFASDPRLYQSFFGAFARRGAGPNAVAPSKLSSTNAPIIEDFSSGDALRLTIEGVDDSLEWCDRDGRLDSGERGLLTVSARNVGFSASASPQVYRVRALTQGVTIDPPGLVTFAAAAPFTEVRGSLPVSFASGTSAVSTIEFQLDPTTQRQAPSPILAVVTNFDLVPSATEDFESAPTLDRGQGWRRYEELDETDDTGDSAWKLTPFTLTQTVVSGPNAPTRGSTSLVTPPLPVGTSPLLVRFRHRYAFETSGTTNWDGAFLELSEDGARTWTSIGSAMLSPAYPGVISAMSGSTMNTNPHVGRAAFVGRSAGYPNFVNEVVNLGTAYAGKTVQLRFVIATDNNGSAPGWDLDDVEVAGITSLPFTQRATDRARCVNRPPTVDAGADRTVKEREQVSLAAMAVDPDGDPVQLEWRQVSGPSVTLTSDQFTAPDVTRDTVLEFEVTARDAALSGTDRVRITVEASNVAPLVMAGGPATVRSGETFTVTSTTSDPDGDVLEVTFVQTEGPLAKPLGGGKFVAPAVKAPDRMYFDVRASDGQLVSTAIVSVGLEPSACGCSSGSGSMLLALVLLVGRRLSGSSRSRSPNSRTRCDG